MLGRIIEAINKELNAYMRLKFGVKQIEDMVVLSNVIAQDGSIAVKKENKIVMTIVNIARDGSKGGRQGQGRMGGKPPTNLSLYLLFSAYFPEDDDHQRSYLQSLDQLSTVVSYFQSKGYFSSKNTPAIPNSLGTLNAELMEMDFHQLSNMWGAIGGKYMPSVLYRIRSISISDDRIQRRDTDIKDIEY